MTVIQSIRLSAAVPAGGPPPASAYAAFAGNTLALTIAINDASGSPIDLTGCTVKYVTIQTSGGEVWRKTAALSDQGTNTGECVVSLAATETSALSGAYLHFVVLTDEAGHVTTVMTGAATFQPNGV